MEKPKKIFIPSTGRALVAGEARRKRPRFVLIWWGRQTKKLKFRRSRQVLGEGAFMKKTKLNFYSFDGPCVSLEKRAKTNKRFCPYLVGEAFAKASDRPPEGERETSLRKELSTVIDEMSVGDRREPASGRVHACVEKSVSGAFEAQESDLRRKKNKISSFDGGPTLDPEIRHTPDFLILLSGGGISGKRGVRGKKKKISFFGGQPVSLLRIRHPCDFLSFPSEGGIQEKTASGEKKRKFLPPIPGGFPGEAMRRKPDYLSFPSGGPDAKRRQTDER